VGTLVNHAGFDIFDPDAMAHQTLRPMFGGGPDATTADPDATERAFQAIPPMATMFATMKADFDQAQGAGHWRAYVHQFFDRAAAPLGYGLDDLAAVAVPTLVLVGDRDPFCPVEAACDVYRRIEGGALGIVPGTGHEISAAIVKTMADFLASVAGA
jgi:pimeloyl-ACP methyl ester carboxylesterase